MDEQKLITPKSKVLQVIEQYPQLEDVLIEYVPAFSKLKNPLLRKTVGRIATLQQAATIGEVKVEDLVNRLRKEVGQDLYAEHAGTAYQIEKPHWFANDMIAESLDAAPMLAEGSHPVNQVMADLNNLADGKIFELRAPFLPAPLIDKASSLGFKHWVKKEADDLYFIYFYRD